MSSENSRNFTRTRLIIDGEWRPASENRSYRIINPANPEEIVGEAARADTGDVDLAVDAATRAFPGWAALSFQERAAYLREVAVRIVADEDELRARVRLFTREHGKILRESTMELTRLGDRFNYCAAQADRLAADQLMSGPPFDTIITHQPRGVAALIVPWNWPMSILGAKLPQALIAGNTVVIKPAQRSAMAPVQTMRIMAEVLPPGVINVLTGSSSEIGDALVSHPLISKINFTGGVETGKHVMRVAADTLKPVTLELGGNDAALVLDDAMLDGEAIQRMVLATFMTSGQVCMAIKRIYVHETRYDELLGQFMAATDRFVVGNGLDEDVTMGPLNNAAQLNIVQDFIADARQRGATIHELGQIADEETYRKGYFQRPVVVTGADRSMKIVAQEQFGPAIAIMPFTSDDEAVQLANDSEFGLSSSVWTQDRERALRVARRLEAGYTYLNAHGPTSQDNRAPFGGFKQSGIGRNLGIEGIMEFLEPHSISSAAGWLQ
jgi:acyl-CoA reductase-like NAD-dependent aldehyde dehydrogenase